MNELRRLADPTLIVVSFVYGLALKLAAAAGLFGIVLGMLVLFSTARYGYEVLRAAAQGRKHLPAPGIESMNPVGEISLVLHFVFFASLARLLANPDILRDSSLVFGARLGLLVVVLAFPASAALMSLTQSLGAALDPRRIAGLVTAIGRPYAMVPAVTVAFALLVALLRKVDILGAILGLPATVFGLFAVFYATGLTLRSVRDSVEIPGEKLPEEEYAEHLRHRDWQSQLDVAYASIRSGLTEQGYRTIRALLDREGSSDEAHRWVLHKMLEWEDRTHARAFGASYVERLLGADRKYAALELAVHLRDDAGRIAVTGTAAAALADYAQSIGRYRLADELRGL